MAMNNADKLKKQYRALSTRFSAYAQKVSGTKKYYTSTSYFNYADFRHIVKDLEGKKKTTFVRKAKRFFAARKKLEKLIIKAAKEDARVAQR